MRAIHLFGDRGPSLQMESVMDIRHLRIAFTRQTLLTITAITAIVVAVAATVVPTGCAPLSPREAAVESHHALVLERCIQLPGVAGPADRNGIAGRLDHLAYDPATQRLFIAAFSKGSLEVVDLSDGKLVKTVEGIPEAQGVAVAPALGLVFVSSGDEGTIRSFDTRTLKPIRSATVIEDADNVRFDVRTGRVLVGGGSKTAGKVIALDPATLATVTEVSLPSHAESFQVDPASDRMFINIPGDKYSDSDGLVVVADRSRGTPLATWTLSGTARNFAMAVDPAHNRIFVVSRKPAKVVMLDASSGKSLGMVTCVPDCDDVFYDATTHRLFVIGGGRRVADRAGEAIHRDQPGALDVFAVSQRNELSRIASIPLPPHARTGLFVPERRMLYVAVPVQDGKPAEILEYRLAD